MIKKPTTVLQYLEYFLAQRKRMINTQITKSTYGTYIRRKNNIIAFLEKNSMSGCLPVDISIQVIREFEVYLIGEKKYTNDYSMKCIQILARVLKLALENKDILTNPIDLYNYHYDRDKILVYLELEELERIKKAKLNLHHRKTRNLFLFSCYTGLCFADVQAFDYRKNIIEGPDKKKWIFIHRKKNQSETYVPLLKEAQDILAYYYYKLPTKSNQVFNKGIKVIAKEAKIKKHLTSHVARKTFGNILHNELNVPIESVSRMLGHKSLKTTQNWYVQTNLKKIMNDMKGVSFTKVA